MVRFCEAEAETGEGEERPPKTWWREYRNGFAAALCGEVAEVLGLAKTREGATQPTGPDAMPVRGRRKHSRDQGRTKAGRDPGTGAAGGNAVAAGGTAVANIGILRSLALPTYQRFQAMTAPRLYLD